MSVVLAAAVVAATAMAAGFAYLLHRERRSSLRARRIAAAERTADRAAHHEVERLLSTALASVPDAVVVCDAHGREVVRNRGAEALAAGWHADALAERALQKALTAGLGGTEVDETLELAGPPPRTLVVSARPLCDGERTLGAIGVVADVTERRRLEAMRRDFVANLSHELKTPIGAVGLLAETLAEEDEPEVARRLAERIQLETFRVSRVIDDLLDLSRIEVQTVTSPEPLQLAGLVEEAVARLRPAAEQRGVELRSSLAADVRLLGDRRQLVSAIHNLVENAIKYSDAGSPVEISATPDGDHVDVTVRDHGIGIPARDLDRIFERFYRVDRARARDTGGTGLGLSIVRHVAENHGGDVRVESIEGAGSTFVIRLPAAPPNVTRIDRAG